MVQVRHFAGNGTVNEFVNELFGNGHFLLFAVLRVRVAHIHFARHGRHKGCGGHAFGREVNETTRRLVNGKGGTHTSRLELDPLAIDNLAGTDARLKDDGDPATLVQDNGLDFGSLDLNRGVFAIVRVHLLFGVRHLNGQSTRR